MKNLPMLLLLCVVVCSAYPLKGAARDDSMDLAQVIKKDNPHTPAWAGGLLSGLGPAPSALPQGLFAVKCPAIAWGYMKKHRSLPRNTLFSCGAYRLS